MIRTLSSILLVAGAAALPAQSWVNLNIAGPAPATPLTNHGMAYDLLRAETVLYGGRQGSSLGTQETWTFDGQSWTQKTPATTPPALWGHAMVGAPALGGAVLFGGRIGTSPQNGTWLWDGMDWQQVQTTNSPPVRAFHQMAFDSRRSVVVVFGGAYVPPSAAYQSTWEFDGTDWTEVITPTIPALVGDGRMVYDESRGVCVMYGGWDGSAGAYGGTWEYDGIDWRNVVLSGAPAGRQWLHLSYDTIRARTVLHGGFVATNDTWEYDGQAWLQMTPSGLPTDAPDGQMVYDLVRNMHFYFGGRGPSGANIDTWAYVGNSMTASYAFAGTGCSGSAPILAAAAGSAPRAGQTFDLEVTGLTATAQFTFLNFSFTNTGGLPLELSSFNMPGCYQQCGLGGTVALPVVGGVSSFSWALPSWLPLGLRFWNQAVVIDSAAGPSGLNVSNAARGYIGT